MDTELLHFFQIVEPNKGDVAIWTIVAALATAAAAVFAAWNAFEARRTANTVVRQNERTLRPYVAFDGDQIQREDGMIKCCISIKNIGSVPAIYHLTDFWRDEAPVVLGGKISLFPGQIQWKWVELLKKESGLSIIRMKFEYFINDKDQHYINERIFKVKWPEAKIIDFEEGQVT
jgi:hypothetical protein